MKDVILKSGICFADEDTWNKLWDRYQLNLQSPENKKIDMYGMLKWETNKEENLLNALSCTPSFELLKKFIIWVPKKVPSDINPVSWFKNIVLLNEKGVDAILDVLESKPTKDNGQPLFQANIVYEGCQAVRFSMRTEDQVEKICTNFVNTRKWNYTLEITYRGLISKNKLETFIYVTYRDRFKGKQWLLLTNIKSNQDASKIFPCLLEDEPTKVTLELSVQHHRGFTALSNTQYNSIIASNEGFKNVWTTFDKTPLLLTRQLNLIIGNLECSTYYDEEYRVWTLKNVGNNHKNLSIIGGKIWKAMKNITGIIDGDTVIKKFYFVLLHGIDFPLIDPFFSYGIIVANSEKFSYVEYHSNFTSINQFAQQIAFSICMQWYPLFIQT
ncbi:hypothetical protein KQX54_009744 [Cotesia glomerata]|uniref:Aminopeptidase N-like N-terminal domain-containing protein n=1 Tax=Cotesia glomerata TaxID=32391 RepID=A0AAV7ICM4_COTGL|nr:hypothetical protein KQX54_009744 [Cotesia glomerata]